MRPGVVYEFHCNTCMDEGKQGHEIGTYIGESARTAFDRGLEHEEAIRTLNPESPLVEHSMEAHGDRVPSFQMKVVSYHKTNLMRQATEATRIQIMEGGNLLNRRGEWGQNLPPKLVLEDPAGGNTTAPQKHKRKVEQSMTPAPAPEATQEGGDPQDPPAPTVLVDSSALDGGVQRKRARMETRIKEQKMSGIPLAPARSKSRSIKEMIKEMNARKQKQSSRIQVDMTSVTTNVEGAGSGVLGSGDEPHTPPKHPNFHGENNSMIETESRLHHREPGVKEGQSKILDGSRGNTRNLLIE